MPVIVSPELRNAEAPWLEKLRPRENHSVEKESSFPSSFRKMLVVGEKIAKGLVKNKNVSRKECRVEGQ
jgi:hypothetical protein